MKKAKSTITYVLVGIIIMWLAYGMVRWMMQLFTATVPTTTTYNWLSIPEANAAYTENELDTFSEYQNRLRIAIENIE